MSHMRTSATVATAVRTGTIAIRGVVMAAALFVLAASAPAAAQQQPAQQPEAWRLIQPPQSSLIFDREGGLVGELGREWRTSVPITTLPDFLPQAFIAIEDHRFYDHDGVDIVGIAGAVRDRLGGTSRGASTITQQLIGNMHPDIIDRTDLSLTRKVREQAAAREMERRYTKAQILEAYLNQLHFGYGWYGVEAASRHYFGKGANAVTLAEAATLAAIINGPAIYDPIRHVDRTRGRRNTVLDRMAEQGFITRQVAADTKRLPLETVPNAGMSIHAPYFTDAVRQQLDRAGIPVMNGGYRVFTTLDPALQRAAQEALSAGATRVEQASEWRHTTFANRGQSTDYLQGAVVAMDPARGEVRALVGGRDYRAAPFNRAVNGFRQPGSAFKPIVYAAAVANQVAASAWVADTALALEMPNGTIYSPANSDRQFRGAITLRDALTYSRNPVAVQLSLEVGMDSVIALAQRMGITSAIAPFPSSAIGASVVSPLELVRAYAAIANLGVAVEPRMIARVEDRAGRTIWTPPTATPALALDPRVAFIVRDMLRDAVERGTAGTVRQYVPARIPVAGKTGTTNDNTDAWFVGMTPEIVAGVWLGFDRPKPIGSTAFGGTMAAPVWGDMIARYYEGRNSSGWTPPGGLLSAELDRVTAEPATEDTPPDQRYTEYFLAGTEPASLRADPWRLFRWGPIVIP
jgi:penicillin-binding protein 2D